MDPEKIADGIKGAAGAAGKKGGGMGPQVPDKISPTAGASHSPNAPTGSGPTPSERLSDDSPGGSGGSDKSKGKSLTDRALAGGGGGKPQNEGEGAGERAKEEVKNAVKPSAQNAKEMASDIKDIAAASKDAGITESVKEVEKGREKAGAKGAAAAAGREAAGHAVAGAVDVLTVGAGAEAHGVIQKSVSKGLKKENLIRIGLVFLVPFIIIGLIIFALVYVIANPYDAVKKVLLDGPTRSFTTQAAGVLGKSMLDGAQHLADAGYVPNRPGSAIAAPAVAPKPGSLLDKFTKINVDIAKYQTLPPDCPYTFTTKQVVNVQGQTTSVIDKVYNRQTKQEVTNDNSVVLYCVMDLFPLNGMFVRTQNARDVNAFSNTHLNYAEPTSTQVLPGEGSQVNSSNPTGQGESNGSSISDLSNTEMDKFVYDKTYNNITSKSDQNAKIEGDQNLTEYITKVRAALEKGDDPYSIDSNFQFAGPADANDNTKIISTMCNFSKAYMEPENLRASINSRFNTGSRSGVKSATLADTRKSYGLGANELNATFQQLNDWASSRAYGQEVDRTQTGEAINPESLSNTGYGASFEDILALLLNIRDECQGKDVGGFLGFFTTHQVNEQQVLTDYKKLQEIMVAQSNGKFTSVDDFGTQQLMINLIRGSGGSAVSGLEPGPWNFNNQAQGFRQLYSQYMLKIGGRYLTSDEDAQLATLNENTRRDVEQQQGIAFRLFNTDNISSVASQLIARTPRTAKEVGRESTRIAASFSNPIKSLLDLQGSFSYIAFGSNNKALAASSYGNAYFRIDTIAYPQKDAEGKDIFANSDEVQNMKENGTDDQKKMLAYYEGCSKMNLPSRSYFVPQFKVNADGTVDKNQIVHDNTTDPSGKIKNVRLPIFPAMEDKVEYTDRTRDDSNFSQQEKDANNQPKEEKKQWMACLIMLQPTAQPNGTLLYITDDMSQFLFHMSVHDAGVIASKYRLYLYSNTLVDNMVQLSSTKQDNSIYANSGGGSGGGGGGSAQCQSASGNEKIPCEGLKYIGLPYDFAHSNVRVGGVEKYRQRCTDDKLATKDPSCAVDCSSFVAAMLYDAFGNAPGFAKDLALYVDVNDGFIHTVNNESLSPQYFKEIKFPDEIKPGDIVTMPDHMGTVKSYDPASGKATTVESYGGASGGPHQVDWGNISEEGFNRAWRYIGPGSTN